MASSDLEPASANRGRRRPAGLPIAAVCSLLTTLLLAPAATARPTAEGAEAGRLFSALGQITELAQRQLRPPAQRLARDLPAATSRLERLREPAATVQSQLGIALDELQRMNVLVYDPRYMPALIAVGRAFLAASGQDPLTRTTVNPDYLGLEPELAGNATRLATAANDATKLSRDVKRLSRALARSKRRARLLERRIERIHIREARLRRR